MSLSQLNRPISTNKPSVALLSILLLLGSIYTGNFIDLLFITIAKLEIPGKVIKNFYIIVPIFLILASIGKGRIAINVSDRKMIYYLLFLIILSIVIKNKGGNDAVDNLRMLIVFPLFYFIGKTLYSVFGKYALGSLAKSHFILMWAIIIIGVIEISFNDLFWRNLDVYNYYASKVDRDFWNPDFSVPRAWVSWDLENYVGTGVRRMVSMIMEPAGIGRLIGISLILTIYFNDLMRFKRSSQAALVVIFTLCGLLTISKGFLFLVALYAIAYKFGIRYFFPFFLSLVFIIFSIIATGHGNLLGPSALNHLSNVYYALDALRNNPLGLGIGVEHVASVLEAVDQDNIDNSLRVRSEGGVMVFVLLFGWFGLLLYATLFFTSMIPSHKSSPLLYKTSLLCFIVILSSIFAHSAFSAVGSGLVFMLYGALASHESNTFKQPNSPSNLC